VPLHCSHVAPHLAAFPCSFLASPPPSFSPTLSPCSSYGAYRSGLIAFIFTIGFFIPLVFCLYRMWVSRARRIHATSHLERRLRELLAHPYNPAGLHAGLTPLERSLLVSHRYQRPLSVVAVPAAEAQAQAGGAAEAASAPLTPASPPPLEPPLSLDKCCICLAEFEAEEDVLSLPCAHVFHTPCASRWLEQSTVCPLCKHDMRPVLKELITALSDVPAHAVAVGRPTVAASR
jgi:hypothetical protein